MTCSTATSIFKKLASRPPPGPRSPACCAALLVLEPCAEALDPVDQEHDGQGDAQQHGANDGGAHKVILLQALEDEHGGNQVLQGVTAAAGSISELWVTEHAINTGSTNARRWCQ